MSEIPQRSSLVGQVADILRRGIKRGDWIDYLPGETELQDRLKVGRNTLRSALHILRREGWIEVSQGRRRRIARRSMPNRLPKGKKSVGVLAAVPYHTLPSFSLFLISELQEDLQKVDCVLKVHADRRFNSANPSRLLANLLTKSPAACWVLVAPPISVRRWFTARRIPVIQAGASTQEVDVPFIDVDVLATARHVVGILLARGHKRIALIRPQADFDDCDLTERGVREGFSAVRRPADASLNVIQLPNIPKAIHATLDSVFAAPDRPTALVFAWTKQVLKVTSYLAMRGIRFPQDVSLISMGHLPYLDDLTPSIAHYTFDWYAYAKRLQRMVRQALGEVSLPPKSVLIMPHFVDGESVGTLQG